MKYWFTFFLFHTFLFTFSQVRSLDYFVQQATQNSPALKEYENQLLSIRLDSQLLRASLKTQVNFISSGSYAPIIHGYGYDEPISNIANLSALIQASRNFISSNNITAQYRVIALQSRALLDTIRLSQRDLVRTVTEQYLAAYAGLIAADYNKEVYELMKKEEATLKRLTQASVYKQTDYLNFYVTMQQQELGYLQAQLQYNTDYLTLNYLAGLMDTAIGRIAEPRFDDTLQLDFYNSVFYNRFVTDSLRLENERTLVDFQYKPRIGAYTDAGYNSSLQFVPYKNFGFSFGLSLIVPIYDGRQKELKYARIAIQERTRQLNKEFSLRQYRQQTALLQQQLKATALLVDKIRQQITYTHTLVLANNKLLETGDITMRDYVIAINNYIAAQSLLNQNTISRLRIASQLTYWNR